MDRQTTLLAALAALTAAGIVLSVCGFVLFARMRRPAQGSAAQEAPAEDAPESS